MIIRSQSSGLALVNIRSKMPKYCSFVSKQSAVPSLFFVLFCEL